MKHFLLLLGMAFIVILIVRNNPAMMSRINRLFKNDQAPLGHGNENHTDISYDAVDKTKKPPKQRLKFYHRRERLIGPVELMFSLAVGGVFLSAGYANLNRLWQTKGLESFVEKYWYELVNLNLAEDKADQYFWMLWVGTISLILVAMLVKFTKQMLK